jgi:hypothetical protein
MEFKVGDHVNYLGEIGIILRFHEEKGTQIEFKNKIAWACASQLTLCLPEKWAIKTDRQEFWDHYKDYGDTKDSKYYHHFPAFGNGKGGCCAYHADLELQEGYTEITFDYWCRVHRPDLLNDPKKLVFRGVQDYPKVINSLMFWGNSLIRLSNNKTSHLPDCRSSISTTISGLKLLIEDLKTTPALLSCSEIPTNSTPQIFKSNGANYYKIDEVEKSEIPINPERKIVGYKPAKDFESSSLNETYFQNGSMYSSGKGNLFDRELFERLIEYGVYVPVYEKSEMTPERFFEKWFHVDSKKESDFKADIKKLLEDK